MTERENIATIQQLKADIVERLRELMTINKEAGRAKAQNAAFLTLSELNVWHGNATERLLEHYPGFDDVVIQGGGGR